MHTDDREAVDMAIELIAAMVAEEGEPCSESIREALRLRLLGENGEPVPLREVERRTGINKNRVARLAAIVPSAVRTALARLRRAA